MDYLRQIEEDLRNISIESKLQKKYPEVCDAVDRALDALKSMREVYVSEIMKKSKTAKLPQSSDVLSPYLLVCNYADGNAKVTLMALNGINLLLTYDLVPPNDAKNIMRALSIQASSKIVDIQLKLLQVVLQLANSLSQTADHAPYLTESMFCGFLTLTMQLCDSSNKHNVLSVSSTALGTVRQIIAQVMDGARAQFPPTPSAQSILLEVTVDQASSKYSLTAIMLVREMCLFIQGLPGDWIRGVVLPQLHALDLLTEILCDWRLLFQRVPFFKKLVQDTVFPALRPLLKSLQAEYVHCAQTQGVAAAGAYCSKVVRLARCVLLHFVVESSKCSSNTSIAQVGEQAAGGAGGNLNVEAVFIISMLVHTLQPDRAGPPVASVGGALEENTAGSGGTATNGNEGTFKSRWEEASSMFMQTGAGAGMFLTRLANPSASLPAASATKATKLTGTSGGSGSAASGVANGFYLHLPGSGPAGGGSLNVPYNSASAAVLLGGTAAGGAAQLPIFPALCCLEVLLAFFLSDLSPLLVEHCAPAPAGVVQGAATTASPSKGAGTDTSTYSKVGSGLHLFESLLVSTALGVCTFLQSAMSSEANIKELDCSLRSPTPLSKLLKSLLNGSFDHDETPPLSSHSAATAALVGSATVDGMVASDNKLTKSVHELLHSMATGSSSSPSTAPADLMILAFYMMQFVSRLLMTVSMQLGVGTGALGGGQQKTLRRSFSSSSSGARRLFLSPTIASLVSLRSCAPVAAVSVGLVALIKKEPARSLAVSDALGRTCDSVYEACLDACSLLLNATSEAPAVRAALGVMSELAIVAGMLDLPKQCDIVTSVLCKYTVPMWHAQELYSTGTAADFAGAEGEGASQLGTPRVRREASVIQWRHYQAFVRLTQVIHLIADTVSDWDNIVDAFEQLVDYFVAHKGGGPVASAPSPTQPGSSGRAEKDAFQPDVDKVFDSIERFKQYSVFLSDDALVRLMTSLVALSMNHLAVNATSVAHSSSSSRLDEMDRERGSGSRSGGAGGDNIIQVNASPFAPAAGGVGGASGPGGSMSGSGNRAVLSRIRPGSSSAGLAYMAEGIRSGTISFSLQALIEVTKLNSFRISTIWQMVISHLRMVASLKSANSRAISVAATHDVILSSMRYMQQQQQAATGPSAGIPFLRDNLTSVAVGNDAAAAGCVASLVMADELMFNFVLPPFESVFVGRDFQRTLLEGRDDRMSTRPALSQSDLLSSLKALSSVRYSDVRSAIIEGLSQLLQGRGHIISSGVGGGWPVILDIISSVPLSMAPVANSGSSSPTPSEQQMHQLQLVYGSEGLETPSTDDGGAMDARSGIAAMESEALSTVPATTPLSGRNPSSSTAAGFVASGSMASLSGGGVIPQYQWPLESLVSAFNCMKLIVDEFLEVLVPECELVCAVLHGLALFGSQVKDVNISLTSVEMLWKVTDSAITFARSNEELRLSGSPISSPHYVALVFDIMLKKLFQMSNDGQPLIRHCAMNTLFSAMSTHAPIISTEQWQQVFGNIIFPLFERAGARSRIAMWSKEEAIAPELKKGVKMSVHHSRDTAHKQWSETRVIGLRGLSRVLRTCTRLLLQESWFRVIWTDALSVCQGALQAACDEQEVSIAALDVIFTMLQIIIQTDAIGPAPVSVGALPEAPGAKRSAGKSVSTALPPPATVLSKDEVENIERCKHTLWQLTWSAVRNTAFFTCNSVELALAISQKLKELYKSRIDREFRYSDNVRVLLEILVALVRPRVGLLRSNQFAAADQQAQAAERDTYYPVPDLITQKQDRVAESQLQRAVIDLLSIIQPADGLAQSCLMSTLAEICFSVLWVQVQVQTTSHSALVASADESDPSSPLSAHSAACTEPDWLILGAAPERLRKEAAEQLGQLLQLQFGQHQEGTLDVPTCTNKTFPWATGSTHFTALLIDIVVRRFVADICEGPLLARSSNSNSFRQPQQASGKAIGADSKQKKTKRPSQESADGSKNTDGTSGGFLASFSSIMSSFNNPSSGQKLQPVYPKHAVAATGAGPAIASARIAGGTLHKFSKYLAPADAARTVPDCTPSALSITGSTDSLVQRWHNFYMVDSEIRLLLTAVQACYSLMSVPHQDAALCSPTKSTHIDSANSSVGPVTEVVWNSLLAATACLLSPWKAAELCAKAGSSQATETSATGMAGTEKDAALAGPAHAIANIIQVSLKIIDYMGYPSAMTVHWVDVLTRSTVLGMHVLGSFGTSDEATLSAVGEFYGALWRQVAVVLGSTLAAERDAHQDVRSRALWGALEIAKTAILSVQKSAQGSNGTTPVLVSTCDDFLNLLVRTRSTAAMFRAVDQAQREDANVFGEGDGEDAMVAKWMHSCKLQSTHLSGAGGVAAQQSGELKQRKSVTGRTTKTSECTVATDSSDQRHLVLVVPHCLELILGPCASSELKATAASVVRHVDMAGLARSLLDLNEENERLRSRNVELERDILTIKSANTLPF